MTTPRIEEMVEEMARDIESRLVHKLQIETTSTKGQSIEYRKGLRDMRYLVMEFTKEIASIPLRQALTEAHQAGIDEAVEVINNTKTREMSVGENRSKYLAFNRGENHMKVKLLTKLQDNK